MWRGPVADSRLVPHEKLRSGSMFTLLIDNIVGIAAWAQGIKGESAGKSYKSAMMEAEAATVREVEGKTEGTAGLYADRKR